MIILDGGRVAAVRTPDIIQQTPLYSWRDAVPSLLGCFGKVLIHALTLWTLHDFVKIAPVAQQLREALPADHDYRFLVHGRVEGWRGNPLGKPLSVSGVSTFVPG